MRTLTMKKLLLPLLALSLAIPLTACGGNNKEPAANEPSSEVISESQDVDFDESITDNTEEVDVDSTSSDLVYVLTGSEADGKKLSVSELLATTDTSTFIFGGTEYTAYNGFIEKTACANLADAKGFIKLLNDNNVDGCSSWTLLTTPDVAFEWWTSTTDEPYNGKASFGDVQYVLSATKQGDSEFHSFSCEYAERLTSVAKEPVDIVRDSAWQGGDKVEVSSPAWGFVVLKTAPAYQ